MHCLDNGFLIVCIKIGFVLVNCENDYEKDESDSNKDDITPEDLYSFVALIDVVFTDGLKKTCTGTIIHDYVVITTAHCFKVDDDNTVQAELTASFVVIGTKKMFDTGYEQYLPIERVIIHPNYSGWTADLSLVYTFAGMMSDKPGRIVPLASEKTSTPVDSDVTVFSWGRYKVNNVPPVLPKIKKWSEEEKHGFLDGGGRIGNQKVTSYIPLKSSSEEEIGGRIARIGNQKVTSNLPLQSNSEEETDGRIRKNSNEKLLSYLPMTSKINENIAPYSLTSHKIETSKTSSKKTKRQRQRRKKRKNRKRIKQRKDSIKNQIVYRLRQSPTETRSRYRHRPLRYSNTAFFDSEAEHKSWEKNKGNLKRVYIKVPTTETYRYSRQSFRVTSYYRNNWRRKMGDQQNKLTIEIFGFVNMQTCKKLIDRAMPSSYALKNPNEVLCYASEAHFITEEDSGAPAMRRGRLVAVTVGGVDLDGERVAVGMKMTCFCSWISHNLPNSGTTWDCCKNCCETKNETEQNHLHFGRAHASKLKTRPKT